MFTRLTSSRLLPVLGLAAAIATGLLASASVANAQASVLVLRSFTGGPADGALPYGGLIQDLDGTLYGTSYFGGTSVQGTIFRMASDGSGFAILHSFHGYPTDGGGPFVGLIQGSDGTLYGTTNNGGPGGFGTIFQIAPGGKGYGIVHSFSGPDGVSPRALIQGSDGTLYGTTLFGGDFSGGTIFKIAPDGSGFAVLHSFHRFDTTDGTNPYAGLTQGPDGTLYGTTNNGGANGTGAIFQMAPDGSGFTLLHSFAADGSDGQNPQAALLQTADSTLYGTTAAGGDSHDGTIFQIGPDGSGFTVLHSFSDTDGAVPTAGLIQGPDGTLYGTTYRGGENAVGTIFRIAPDGSSFAVVYSFSEAEGANPQAGLIQGPDGSLYGTITTTMNSQRGGVFQLTLSPSAPVTP